MQEMLQGGQHSVILSTFIKLIFVIKIFLSIFEWLFYTGFTVPRSRADLLQTQINVSGIFFKLEGLKNEVMQYRFSLCI